MYYNINNVIEGNTTLDEYKMNFVSLLNKDIKTSFREDILYDRILNSFTRLLKLLDKSEGRIPPTQMCGGALGRWSECSRECGRGNMTRQFNVRRKAGKDGIKCIYENGQQETKECFNRLCDFHELCEEDHDCLSNYCSSSEKICTYPHMCERDKLQNCNFEQCQELEDKYGDYTYDTQQHRCVNKFIDLNVKELSIKDEVSLEAVTQKKNVKDTKAKMTAEKLNNDIRHICSLSEGEGNKLTTDCGGITGTPELIRKTCNTHRNDKGIPCYYDYEKKGCIKVSENPDFDNWDDIQKGFKQVESAPHASIESAEEFFNCENLIELPSATTEGEEINR